MTGKVGRIRLLASVAAALLLGGCLGAGGPSTAAGVASEKVAPEKQRDTCQHTSEGGQARTVCY